MKRVELLTALDELDSVLEDALVDNAHVVLRRSRARMQAWYDWMLPQPEDDQRPPAQWLDCGYEDVTYCLGDETLYERWWANEVEAGRPWPDPPSSWGRFHTDECYVGDNLSCYRGFADKAHCVYRIKQASDYVSFADGESYTHITFSYLTQYGGAKDPNVRYMYAYDEVERTYQWTRDGSDPAEREMDTPGRYI